jgi:hypothetical protein
MQVALFIAKKLSASLRFENFWCLSLDSVVKLLIGLFLLKYINRFYLIKLLNIFGLTF